MILSNNVNVNNKIPKENIPHLIHFLKPLSFENLNNSKSPLPTNAPEKAFESGDIIKLIIKIKILKTTKKETKIIFTKTSLLLIFIIKKIILDSLIYLFYQSVCIRLQLNLLLKYRQILHDLNM